MSWSYFEILCGVGKTSYVRHCEVHYVSIASKQQQTGSAVLSVSYSAAYGLGAALFGIKSFFVIAVFMVAHIAKLGSKITERRAYGMYH
jgi:hypothetical protein